MYSINRREKILYSPPDSTMLMTFTRSPATIDGARKRYYVIEKRVLSLFLSFSLTNAMR